MYEVSSISHLNRNKINQFDDLVQIHDPSRYIFDPKIHKLPECRSPSNVEYTSIASIKEKNTVQEVEDRDEETNTQIMDGSIGASDNNVKEIVAGLGQTGLFSNTLQSEGNFLLPDITNMTLEEKMLQGHFRPNYERNSRLK